MICTLLLLWGLLFGAIGWAVSGSHPNGSAALSYSARASLQKASNLLEVGSPVKKDLAGGEGHTYRVSLNAGQFVEVLIQQQGIRVAAVVSAAGKAIAEMNSVYGSVGPVAVAFIAPETADYIVTVRSTEQSAPAGSYEIRLAALRMPTSVDLSRVAAQRRFEEGRKLRSQPSSESRRQAIKKYEEALADYRAAADQAGEASTLQAIGLTYRFLGDMEQAANFYSAALALQRTLGDSRGQAFSLNYLGLAQAISGYFRKALESYAEALPIWQAENDKLNEADTLNRIGGAHDALGELQTALHDYNLALKIRHDLADRVGEAQTLNNIGLTYQKLGELQAAIEHYNLALAVFQEAKEYAKTANALNNIGFLYASLGDSQKALEYYEQARETRKQAEDPLQEAITISNIGHLFTANGDFLNARSYYEQALKIQQEAKNTRYEAYTLIHLGQIHLFLSEPQKALEHFERALKLLKDAGDREGEALALDKIGQVLAALGNTQAALEKYDQALRLWRTIGSRSGEAATLYNIARAERDRGNLTDAQSRIAEALKIVEALRTKVVSQDLRAAYLASVRDYYDLGIDLLMQMHQHSPSHGFDAAAFELSERGRARSLLDMLLEAHINIREGVNPDLLQRERSLQQQLNAAAERQRQLLSGQYTEEQSAALEKELRAILTQYQEVQSRIRTNNPNYAYLTNPESLSLKDIQQALDPDTLLLEFNLGRERSYVWAITPDSLASFELPGRSEIESASRRVYDLLTAPGQFVKGEGQEQKFARLTKAEAEFPEATDRLARIVIAPVAARLKANRLLIVADGALQYVSFAALSVPAAQGPGIAGQVPGKENKDRSSIPDPRPLIIDHEIVNLPSASALVVQRRVLGSRRPAPKAVAVLADPVYSRNDTRLNAAGKLQEKADQPQPAMRDLDRSLQGIGSRDNEAAIPRLSFSRHEAEEIIKSAGGKPAKAALDFDASRAAARDPDLSQYRVVHFATHGILNSSHPELSGIVLSLFNKQGRQQDGFLRLHEIYNLKLPAELVVLSACQTGLGKEIRGEGIVGLTRGFMYAGAARLIASLWKVDDGATAELMSRFYKHLLTEQKRPAEALRMAQIEMYEKRLWRNPYYWAAFVLQGEWR
jgi:Uncharacterized protein conserved in bacteria